MKKTILYLDQNFVSNLTKVENVPGWKDPHREFYSSLLQLLRTQVEGNRLACPTSYFHSQESEQSTRIKDHVWHLMERLSRSLSFNSSNQIHVSQLASAAYAYASNEAGFVPDWAIAFNQDPYGAVDSTTAGDEIMVHLGSGQELVDYTRETNDLVADVYGKLKLSRKGQSKTSQEEVIYLQGLLLKETFLSPYKLIKDYPELQGDISDIGAAIVVHDQAKLLAIFRDCGVTRNPVVTKAFLNSQELLSCPFLHIRASLMAADIIHYPDMVPAPSLNTDFEMVASILPYVDILATDNHMAELIRKAGLSDTFPAQVFSMNRRNDLLKEIEML